MQKIVLFLSIFISATALGMDQVKPEFIDVWAYGQKAHFEFSFCTPDGALALDHVYETHLPLPFIRVYGADQSLVVFQRPILIQLDPSPLLNQDLIPPIVRRAIETYFNTKQI